MTDVVPGPSHETRPRPSNRIARSKIEEIFEKLSERDWQIIQAVNQLRVLSGEQLQTLFFSSLPSPRSRVVSRSRTLKRLVDWRVLMPLARRIGGARRGSSGSVFALDSAGQRLIAGAQLADAQPLRVRRPGTPTARTLNHALAASDLYVHLVELGRVHGFTVGDYQVEPGCWWPNGLGGFIKPDAYLWLARGEVIDHWWVEVDRATESLPTLRRKLETYLDFARRGQFGPGGVVPRVLVSTVTGLRRQAVAELVARLPGPAEQVIAVVRQEDAAAHVVAALHDYQKNVANSTPDRHVGFVVHHIVGRRALQKRTTNRQHLTFAAPMPASIPQPAPLECPPSLSIVRRSNTEHRYGRHARHA